MSKSKSFLKRMKRETTQMKMPTTKTVKQKHMLICQRHFCVVEKKSVLMQWQSCSQCKWLHFKLQSDSGSCTENLFKAQYQTKQRKKTLIALATAKFVCHSSFITGIMNNKSAQLEIMVIFKFCWRCNDDSCT